MKYGSLFTGIGGFDLAFTRAGMQCEWQCEIDTHAVDVLKKHADIWGNPHIFGDIKDIYEKEIKPVDLICGGFPCQDVSIAGIREGLDGKRSGLWWEFARIIEIISPRWVVVENVPGLLSSKNGTDFHAIIQWLVQRGYGVAWRIFDAQHFGLAQRRRRVFNVGNLGTGRAGQVLFESTRMQWHNPESRKEGKAVAETLDHHSASGSRGGQKNELDFIVSPTLRADPGTMRYGKDAMITDTIVSNGDGHSGFRNGEGLIAGTVSAKWAKGTGGPAGDEAYNLVASPITTDPYADNGTTEVDNLIWDFHRQDGSYREQDDTSPSVCAKWGTGGNNMPFVGVRRLTPVECERLQGFPDHWTSGQSDTQRYKQLGNAVAVPPAFWIAQRILQFDQN